MANVFMSISDFWILLKIISSRNFFKKTSDLWKISHLCKTRGPNYDKLFMLLEAQSLPIMSLHQYTINHPVPDIKAN